MRSIRRLHWSVGSLVAVTTVIVWAIAPTSIASAQPAPPPASPVSKPAGNWQLISSPNAGTSTTNNTLDGVVAISASDVWAVGYTGTPFPYRDAQLLAEHWDGSAWSIVPTPSPSNTLNQSFSGIASVSSQDVWAVGQDLASGTAAGQTLTEHWNGSAWSVVSSPNEGVGAQLNAVAAVASDDVWAAGYYEPQSGVSSTKTLIEHWDGSKWSIVPSPGTSTNNYLNAITAISADDMWAIGQSNDSGNTLTPEFLHWDGTTWA